MTRAPHLLVRAMLTATLILPLACGDSSDSAGAANVERPPVAVDAVRVEPGNVKETLEVVGTLKPKFEGDVKAEYSGTIREVFVTEWVAVKKGTLLARFDRREIDAAVKAANANAMQAAVAANRAHRELERMVKLKGAGLATPQNLDDAKAAAEAADAQLSAARAQEEMARTRLAKADVRAPMSGVVAARTVNPGDFIENMGAPQPMFRIVDNSRLELTVSIPSSKVASIQLGQPVTFTVDAVPGRTFAGKVSFINPAADEASRTVGVIATVENPDNVLKSGLFVRGSILTSERGGVLRVPRSAMLTWDPVKRAGVVYAVVNDRATPRNVTTGVTSEEEIEIVEGVAAGDVVITRGAFNVREGDRVTVATSSTGA